MKLSWLDPADPDPRDLAAAAAVLEAARVADCPHESTITVAKLAAKIRHGWDGNPPATAVATDLDGRTSGVLEVGLPHWDNTHLGWVDVTVDPLARRGGLGRAMHEAGVARVRDSGRRLVLGMCFDLPGSVAFAKAVGLDQVSEEAKRSFDVLDADWAKLDHLYAEAEQRSAGYALVRLVDAAPEEWLDDLARMTAAINDAPTDDYDVEDEVFSPDRIRAFEQAQDGGDRRTYRLLARDLRTGELAGHTMVGVESQLPGHGHQYDTSVLRAHRGHRLGLRLKIAMLKWLAEAEPQLRVMDTWNAVSNAHMVAVNEALGYRLVAHAIGWQRHL